MSTSNAATPSNRDYNNLRLEEHMHFICPECGKENHTQQEWRKHLNVQHDYVNKTVEDFDFKEIDDKYHECQICLKWVANAHQAIALLQYHRFLHLPYPKTYRCKHCPGSFTRKRALCEHLYRFHSKIVTKMEQQRAMQEIKRATENKDPKHNREFYMKFVCPLCGKIFERFHVWQQHIEAAHSATSVDLSMHRIQNTKNYYCSQCCCTLIYCANKTQLQRHHFTHLPYPQYFQCAYCACRTSYKSELFIHFVKTHQMEYEKCKQYVKKPIEWGGPPNEKIVRELNNLLAEENDQKAAPVKETDILQKALQDSCINLEEEDDKEFIKIINHEHALDQSLKELDDILNTEIDPNLKLKAINVFKDYDLDDDVLEEISKEIFEEIDDTAVIVKQEPSTSQPNRKRLKLDLTSPENSIKINASLQKEMQKYINYLCPECGNEFDSQSNWRTHVFEEHNLANAVDTKFDAFDAEKTSYLCLVCYQVQRTSKHSELRRHHFQHMPYQAYLKCTICTKTKSSKPKMLQHLQYAHLIQIQNGSSSSTKNANKTLRCLECDKMYSHKSRFETHLRQCPKRLQPLAVGQYDIAKNMKLLEHLHNASKRISDLMMEEGLDIKMTLPFK